MIELSLRDLQLAELDILVAFDKFCRENGLIYSLAGGTLLGAVRHKGFIPWDDDIDVCMPRPDYERFLKLYTENNLEFQLTPDRGVEAKYPFTKMIDSNVVIHSEKGEACDYLWIDIFPLDGYPSDLKSTVRLLKKVKFLRRIFGYNYLKPSKLHGIHRKLFYVFAKLYGSKKSLKKLLDLSNKYPYDESEYIGEVAWGIYGVGERLVKEEYIKTVDIEFEGHNFLAMSCWDSYLHGIYGDYMQLPPEEKRVVHGFKAYRVEKE